MLFYRVVVDVNEAHGTVEGEFRAVGKVYLVEALVVFILHDALVGVKFADLLKDGSGDDLVGYYRAGLLALNLGTDAVAVELDVDAALQVNVILHEAGALLDGDVLYFHIAVVLPNELLSRSGEGCKRDRLVLTVVGCVDTADKKAEKKEGKQLFHDNYSME